MFVLWQLDGNCNVFVKIYSSIKNNSNNCISTDINAHTLYIYISIDREREEKKRKGKR